MLRLNDLRARRGARKKKKVVGRGPGSGHGKTSTRGHKGQLSRTGKGKRPGFEGGQMSLIRRLPKRGFTSKFKIEYQVVNLEGLNRAEAGSNLNPETMQELGLIRKLNVRVKILARGKLEKKLTVKAHKFSKAAEEAITAAGGTVELING